MKSSRPASAHCRSSNDQRDRVRARHPLEEQPPAANRSSRSPRAALLEAEQERRGGLDPAPLLVVGHVLLDARASLARAAAGASSSAIRRASAPSRRAPSTRRPRRRRGTVRGASSTRRRGRRCTCRTPMRARLADAGDAGDRDEVRARSSAGAWKSSLTSRSSRSRPTNGGSRPVDFSAPPRAATTRSARQSGNGSALALQLERRRPPRTRSPPRSRAASPRRRRRCPGSAADWIRDGRVHDVAGHHALAARRRASPRPRR